MSLANEQRAIINDFAGHLRDGSYALLGLPNLSRHDRFLIALDLSFFCRIERAAPMEDEQFRLFMRTMLEPFISSEWAASFEFADEVKIMPPTGGLPGPTVPTPRFDAFALQFANSVLPTFRSLERILDPHRPRMVSNPPRPSDTEVPEAALNEMAAFMRTPGGLEKLGFALPAEWRLTTYVRPEDPIKFFMWQRSFNVYKHKPLPATAYIVVYLPHRLLQGLSDIHTTFTN